MWRNRMVHVGPFFAEFMDRRAGETLVVFDERYIIFYLRYEIILAGSKGKSMQSIRMFQVDAFTDKAFGGNPAAVCLLQEPLAPVLMQQIAAENNLSETAFLLKQDDENYQIRWFAPEGEVDLCGHATLASAHVILKILYPDRKEVEFYNAGRRLRVNRAGQDLVLDFPLYPLAERSLSDLPAELLSPGLQAYFFGNESIVLIFDSESAVASYQPPLEFLRSESIFLSITAAADQDDFVSRFFAPSIGINEDPVTGSAHCYLAPFWAERLGKNRLTARQISKRGGRLELEVASDDRVKIAGQSICVMTAEFYPQGL